MNVNLSALSNYFKYPDKIAELKVRLYKILLDKNVEVSAGESLNSLIEKVKQVEGNIPENTIYITENNTETGYDVTNYTKAIVDIQASAVENDLDKLLNNTIESCVIPQSINWLGPYKFYQCVNLEEVQGNTLFTIPHYAFYGCSNLKSINLPYARAISDNAFTNCHNLKELQIPELTHLGPSALLNVYNLKYFDAPNLVSWAGGSTGTVTTASSISYINLPALTTPTWDMFNGLINVQSISMPNAYYLSSRAFGGGGNSKLTELNFPILFSTSAYAITGFNALTSVSFPMLTVVGGITTCSALSEISVPLAREITSGGFTNLSNLRRLDLPYFTGPSWVGQQPYDIFVGDSALSEVSAPYLFSLGNVQAAFRNCLNLTSIEFSRLNSAIFSISAFAGTPLSTVSFPNFLYWAVPSTNYNCFMNRPELTEANFSRLSFLASYMFFNDNTLQSVNAINASYLGSYCFQNCTALSEFYFTGSSISTGAFSGTGIQSLYILNGSTTLVSLAADAFVSSPMTNSSILGTYGTIYVPSSLYSRYITASQWSLISNVIQSLPASIEDKYLLAYTKDSTSAALPEKENVTDILPYAFQGTLITSLNLSEVVNIENAAFSNTTLGQVSLDKVEHVGLSAFYTCGALTSLSAPKLKEIGMNAFFNCYNLPSIYLPELEIVGAGAFSNCSRLSEVNLPSVKMVERYGFYQCSRLSSLSLPEVELIDYSAFMNAYSLSFLSLPKAKIIGSNAFYNCSSLTSIYLPEVEIIEQAAFYSCSRLSSIFAPKVKFIHNTAFYSCQALSFISLPEVKVLSGAFSNIRALQEVYLPEIKIIGSYTFNQCSLLSSVYAGKAIEIGYGAFSNCSSLVSLEFSQVKSIGMSAFMYCSSLVSISLPQIRTIGNSAFYYCRKLEDVYAPNLVTLSAATFTYCEKLPEIPNASLLLSIPETCFGWCSALTEANLPACSYIATNAFLGCVNISQISIPQVSYIGISAFAGMSKLTSISNSLVRVLNDQTFTSCSAIEIIDMPKVSSIGSNTFRDCENLSSLNINFSALTSVPNYAFAGCKKLDIFNESSYWENISVVGEGAFSDCSYLTQLMVPSQSIISNYTYKGTNISDLTNSYITSMGISAFASNNSLENVDLPNCNYIGSSAFQSCPKLSNINLSSSLSYVGMYAFDTTNVSEITSNVQEYIEGLGYVPSGLYRGTNLTSVSFSNIEFVGTNAFENCASLTQLDISSVKDIYGYAFRGCSQLGSVSFPNVYSIGTGAFANCASLSNITLPYDLNRIYWGAEVFSGCSQLSYFDCQNMTVLPNKTFADCVNLVSVDMRSIRRFSADAFNNCPRLVSIYLPYCSSVSIPTGTTWSQNVQLQTLYMPLNNYITDSLSLRNLTNLREVTTPYFYPNRGNYVGCTSLESFYIITSNSTMFSGVQSRYWANTPIVDSTYLGHYGSFYVPSAFYNQIKNNYGGYQYSWISERIAPLPEAIERKFLLAAELSNLLSVPENKLEAEYLVGQLASSYCRLSQLSLSKVAYIDRQAFYFCSTLQEVNLPEALTIPENAFYYCTSISSLNIPKVEEIGNNAFCRCDGLEEVVLGNVKSIGQGAFSTCLSLTRLTMETIYSIGYSAFYNCPKLESITLNNIYYAQGNAFASCYALSEATITALDNATLNNCFIYCSSLANITLNLPSKGLNPNNTRYLIQGCYNIENCTINGSNPGLSLSYLLGPASMSNLYANDIVSGYWASYLGGYVKARYMEMKSLDSVPNFMLSNNERLVTAKLDNASIIGYSAFTHCTNLEYIEFPKATVLSNYNYWGGNYVMSTFYNCQKLSVLVFGASQAVSFSGTFNGFLNNTPMISSTQLGYFGSIYVRKSLIGRYVGESKWATYSSRFAAIEDNLPLLHRLGLCLSFTE